MARRAIHRGGRALRNASTARSRGLRHTRALFPLIWCSTSVKRCVDRLGRRPRLSLRPGAISLPGTPRTRLSRPGGSTLASQGQGWDGAFSWSRSSIRWIKASEVASIAPGSRDLGARSPGIPAAPIFLHPGRGVRRTMPPIHRAVRAIRICWRRLSTSIWGQLLGAAGPRRLLRESLLRRIDRIGEGPLYLTGNSRPRPISERRRAASWLRIIRPQAMSPVLAHLAGIELPAPGGSSQRRLMP